MQGNANVETVLKQNAFTVIPTPFPREQEAICMYISC